MRGPSTPATVSSESTIVHSVEVRHAVTQQPIVPIEAGIPGSKSLWKVKKRENWIVLHANRSDIASLPPKTTLVVRVPQAGQRAVLIGRTIEEDGQLTEIPGEQSVELLIDQQQPEFPNQVTLNWQPAPMVLQLHLVGVGGRPPRGLKDVRVLSASGEEKKLEKVAAHPGIYRSQRETWGSTFARFAIQVNGNTVAQKSMDYSHTMTRLRQVLDDLEVTNLRS